jgi:RNA polymerase sigma factor (TIGR02999 family)
MGQVSQLLEAVARGERPAAELLPLVYEELRRLAAARLRRESPGHTLQPTALVHEAWIKLVGAEDGASTPHWHGEAAFFTAAAEAMRRILVDYARRKQALKRGGQRQQAAVELDELALPETREDLTHVSDALDQLAEVDAQAAELVKLRYFAGLPMPQIADILDLSPRTADRVWSFAKAWLFARIQQLDKR